MNVPRDSFKDKLLVLRHFRLRRIPPAWNETEYLIENGFPILVVEFGNLKEGQRRLSAEIPRLRIANPWAIVFPSLLRPLCILGGTFFSLCLQIFKSGRPRFVVAHGLHEALLAIGLRVLFGVPYAIHAHEIYDRQDLSRLNRFFFRFEGLAFRQAAFLIFPERIREKLYRARYRFLARSYIVYNCPRKLSAISPMDLKAKFHMSEEAKLLGYWGGIGQLNAIAEAIRALTLLPQFYFVIWGWGEKLYLQKLRAIAEDTGVLDRVIFAGEMPTTTPNAKWDCLAGLDVGFCVYDPRENLRARYQATASNKFMESIAVGVPVITSASSDFKQIVERENIGVCATHLTAAAIAGAIRELTADDEKYAKKKQNALKLHQNYYHFEAQFQMALKEFAKRFELQGKTHVSGLNPLPSHD